MLFFFLCMGKSFSLMGEVSKVPFYFLFLGLLKFFKFIYKSTNLAFNEANKGLPSSMAPRFFHSDRVSIRAKVPYSREVARFALFGGRLPKVKVLTADVPIVNLRSTNPSKSADKTSRQPIFIQICWKETRVLSQRTRFAD